MRTGVGMGTRVLDPLASGKEIKLRKNFQVGPTCGWGTAWHPPPPHPQPRLLIAFSREQLVVEESRCRMQPGHLFPPCAAPWTPWYNISSLCTQTPFPTLCPQALPYTQILPYRGRL